MLFRFFATYFTLYIATQSFFFLWDPIIDFLAESVLHLPGPITVKPNGSGDTTYNYVQVLGIFLVAILGTVLWSILDRKRHNYDKLLYWSMVLVRYSLAMAMVSYGFSKIIKTQFPFPVPYSLFQPLGWSSPMGLVWKFMGFSTGYNYFTGLAEALGGVLLFFRRTATFGALLSAAVLANIVALNFFFDVPVKLYSSHLLAMALFVAAPDLKRLVSFFFLNKSVPATTLPAAFKKPWMQKTRLILKVSLLVFFFYKSVVDRLFTQKTYGDAAPKIALHGAYTVETFTFNGDTLPPLTTDSVRWKNLFVNHHQFLSTQAMNDSVRHLRVQLDSTQKIISWTSASDSTKKSRLRYQLVHKNQLKLTGHVGKDSVTMQLRRIDLQKLPLVSRDFHWVNEYPYNR